VLVEVTVGSGVLVEILVGKDVGVTTGATDVAGAPKIAKSSSVTPVRNPVPVRNITDDTPCGIGVKTYSPFSMFRPSLGALAG